LPSVRVHPFTITVPANHYLSAEDYFKSLFGFKKNDGYWKWFAGNVASGGAAGASSLLFVYSLDYARTRLANDAKSAKSGGTRQFNGLVDVYKKTLASDGLIGLYRGFVPSVVGIIVYRGLYFGVYDSLSASAPYNTGSCVADCTPRACRPGRCSRRFFPRFIRSRVGCHHRCWSCLVSLGHDTVGRVTRYQRAKLSIPYSRRMMMTSGSGVNYKSMFDAGSQIVAKEGTKSLFKGAGANILRGVAGAGVLSLYDKLQEVRFSGAVMVASVLIFFFYHLGALRQGVLWWIRVDCYIPQRSQNERLTLFSPKVTTTFIRISTFIPLFSLCSHVEGGTIPPKITVALQGFCSLGLPDIREINAHTVSRRVALIACAFSAFSLNVGHSVRALLSFCDHTRTPVSILVWRPFMLVLVASVSLSQQERGKPQYSSRFYRRLPLHRKTRRLRVPSSSSTTLN
jgi:hypothetical protein